MGIILLIIMCILATVAFIARRKYKIAILLMVPILCIIIMFVWNFTLLPYSLRIRSIPTLQFIQIRKATDKERVYFSNNNEYPLYIISFSANMRLDQCRKGNYRLFCSPTESDFNYEDITTSNSMIFFVSEDLSLRDETELKYIYYAPIQFLSSPAGLISNNIIKVADMKTDLRCKVFFVGMLQPIISTSEMIIPLDSINKASIHTILQGQNYRR